MLEGEMMDVHHDSAVEISERNDGDEEGREADTDYNYDTEA